MFLLEYFFLVFIHGDRKGKYIYARPVCHMRGLSAWKPTKAPVKSYNLGFQMAPIHLPYWDISVQEGCSKLNRRLMWRGFFSPPHPAASQSYGQLVHRALSASCPWNPKGHTHCNKWCLLKVTARPPAFSGTLADKGEALCPRGQCAIVLMWFLWYFGSQPQINRLPCADLKIRSAPKAKAYS